MDKNNWTYKKLGEVCAHKNKILRANKYYAPNEQINYIDISSIDNSQNVIISTTPYIFSDAPSRAQQIVKEGDILISLVRPNLKNIAIVSSNNKRFVASSGFCVLRSEADTNNRYVFYIVRGKSFTKHLLGRVQGANYPAVREEDIKNYIVPIPPLAEQERIVAELDLLSSIIDKKKAQLKELDQLAQSIFYTMFGDPITNEKGWEVKKIEDICVSIVRGPFGSALKKEFFVEPNETTYKVYEQKHAIQKSATIGSYYVSEEKYNELSRFELRPFDIIMSCSGTIGELYRLPFDAQKGIMNQALLKFTLNNNVCYEYFVFMMEYMKQNFIVRGSGLQNIGSVKIIKSMSFGLPPLPLQQEFAEKVEAIERQKSLIQQSIVETQTLFDSRMDYWFG